MLALFGATSIHLSDLAKHALGPTWVLARVIAQFQGVYTLQTETERRLAKIPGRLRHKAKSSLEFPAVGDWVGAKLSGTDSAVIEQIFPRVSCLSRKAIDDSLDEQVIAANVNTVFVVDAVSEAMNMNRLERLLNMVQTGKSHPVLILNKCDLHPASLVQSVVEAFAKAHPELKVIPLSVHTGEGIDLLRAQLIPGKTHALIGISGVGKTSLMNVLDDRDLATSELSDFSGKGRHTTTHRELFLLKNNALLMDTPGMRELGITESEDALRKTFEAIEALASSCQFRNCSHLSEPGCHVKEALEKGDITQQQIHHYDKLKKEQKKLKHSKQERREKRPVCYTDKKFPLKEDSHDF